MKGPKKSPALDRLIGMAVLGVFCLASLWLWLPSRAVAPNNAAAPAVDLAARVQAMDDTLADLIAVTTERPLMHATRRPVPEEAPAAPPPAAPEPTLTLLGVLSDGDARLALVRTSTSPELYRLEANTRFGPWEIIEILDNAIRVRKDNGPEQVLRIGQ